MANNITKVWELMGINPATGTGTYKNRMGLGNAITRDNGIPLDLSGLHATYNDAVVYAATSSIAYVDQVISAEGVLYLITETSQGKAKISSYRDSVTGKLVSGEEKEYDIYLKRVGIVPTGDDASIVVNGEGLVKIFAFDGAQTGTVPVKDENGKLVWKTLEEIGDGNDNTTYEFAVCDDKIGIVITPLYNGQPIMEGEGENATQVKYHLDLDVYTKAQTDSKIAEAIGNITFPEPPDLSPYATKEYVDGEVDRLEKAIGDVEAKIPSLDSYATIAYVDGEVDKLEEAINDKADADDLTALSNRVDAFLTGEGTAEALDSLQELIEYINTHDDVEISSILEDIQALENKLAGIDGTVAAYISAAIDALQIGDYAKASDLVTLANRVQALEDDRVTEEELETYKGVVTNAIATAKQEAIELAAQAEEAKGYAVASEVAETYATKAELSAHDDAAEAKYATKDALTAHANAAAATYATKDDLAPVTQTANNASTAVENLEARFDEIVAVGGEPNAINTIKVNGTALTIENKVVNITDNQFNITNMNGYTTIDGRVTQNTNDIAALAGNLATSNTNITSNTEDIAEINTNISTNIAPKIAALEGADAAIEKTLGEHTAAIETLNVTTIPAIQQALANEVKAREDGDKAINDKIGTVESGKTIVGMIADAITSANGYADSLASNYDEAGAADKAFEDAKKYADGLAVNYDDIGSAAQALVDAKAYADGLAGNYDVAGAADGALVAAKAYADGLAGNYDAKGSAEAAEKAAKAYADGLAINYDAKGSAAQALADAKSYTDEVKDALLGTEELVGTYDTLKEIGAWIANSGVDATELASAIAGETSAREEADTALAGRLAILEAIDHDAYVGADAALKEALEGQISALTNGAVKANTDAIAAINDASTGILVTAKAYTDALANGAVKANTDAIAAINNTTTGILAVAKSYTDTEVAGAKSYADGLVAAIVQPKASNEVTVASDGTLGLGEVSTDKLVQGSMTLILHGGDAGVSTQA